MADKFKKSDSLCWNCKRNCSGCSWSKSYIPVNGWVAEKKTYSVTSNKRYPPTVYDSYTVKKCALYEQDNECNIRIMERCEDGVFEMIYGMVDRSVKDYYVFKRWCDKHNIPLSIGHAELLKILEKNGVNIHIRKMVAQYRIDYIGALKFFRLDPFAIFNGMTVEQIIKAIEEKKKKTEEIQKRRANSDRKSRKSKVLSE